MKLKKAFKAAKKGFCLKKGCLYLFIYLLTIYSIQYKYIKEIEITKQTKSCGEGDNQKR